MPITRETIGAALALLAEEYPHCFVLEQYLPHRPLKVGIDHDLAKRCPALSRRERGVALQFYTSRIMYLQGLVEGAGRVDLDGNVCGEVTTTDAEHARSRIAEIMAARDAKVAAAKAASKVREATGKAAKPTVPTAQAAPEMPPAASPAPANSITKLKDRPVLTLPAFRRKAAAS